MYIIALVLKKFFLFPEFIYYIVYDKLIYFFYRKVLLFPGWGIHLFTGKFGQGKTSLMTIKAYRVKIFSEGDCFNESAKKKHRGYCPDTC